VRRGRRPTEATGQPFDPARLIQARKLAGWTRADLADKTGIDVRILQWWEVGVGAPPRHYEIERLAEGLGQLPEFFAAGRPHVRLDGLDVHVC
jgi:transcriptional regulator with XRE-family HTH domain